MKWSPQQSTALAQVGHWLDDPSRQVFRLFGFAGTGKTTLAKHLGQHHDGLVHYAAFTGKAALVLRRKGCAEATTLHSLLYLPATKSREKLHELEDAFRAATPDATKPDGGIDFSKLLRPGSPEHTAWIALRDAVDAEKERLRQPAFSLKPEPLKTVRGDISLIIVDEVSMVDERIGKDLLDTGVKILVLGDPAQLPPVSGGGFFTEAAPDFLLTEVHRQALDSPVLALATMVRETGRIELGQYGDSRVCLRADVLPEEFAATEQLLVGYNNTRRGANRRLRGIYGFDGYLPQPGEKLVCLRNDHSPARRLLNGSLWKVQEAEDCPSDCIFALTAESLDEDVPNGGGRVIQTVAHKWPFMGTEQPEWHTLLRHDDYDQEFRISEMDFGYALTVHKSQGSQWDDVIIIDEWGRADHQRWLYTAITRAAEKVTVTR